MDRDLRKEIEAADAALKVARAELAAARELAKDVPGERAAKIAELRAQLAAHLAAIEALSAHFEALRTERSSLQSQIDLGRSIVERNRAHVPYTPREDLRTTTLEDVVRPTGWRKGQPWYSRLLWWIFNAQEW